MALPSFSVSTSVGGSTHTTEIPSLYALGMTKSHETSQLLETPITVDPRFDK